MFRIKKLDIFIAKQFGLLFIGTFFICQFVLMMQFLWKYVDELIGKDSPSTCLPNSFGIWTHACAASNAACHSAFIAYNIRKSR